MKTKKVSIIIPCYNSEKYLKKCYESVKNQTIGLENLQVIFVDDCSDDKTFEMLKRFELECPESIIAVRLPENRKQGGARNTGLRYATGEYVAFLDSDDWVDVSIYEKTYEVMKTYDLDILQYPFIHVFSSGRLETDKSIRYGLLNGNQDEIKRGILIGSLLTFGSQNKVYRRSLIENVQARFLEGVVYEEPSFVYPLFVEAKYFYCMEEGLYYYCHEHQSVTGNYMGQKTKLYDHPYVQLEILKGLVKNRKAVELYYNEIEIYFLHTYYMETLYFAGYSNLYFGQDYFVKMQKNVQELFPAFKENPYLNLKEFGNFKVVLDSVDCNYIQEELDDFCKEVVRIMNQ